MPSGEISGLEPVAPSDVAPVARSLATIRREPPAVWYAIVAPPNMPPALANTLHASIVKAVHSPAIAEKLVAAGVDPKTDASPAAFAQFVRDDFVRWGKIVKDSGIKAE